MYAPVAIYFSPTGTTKKVVETVITNMNFGCHTTVDLSFPYLSYLRHVSCTNVIVLGIPVYYGRVPRIVLDKISALKGNNTPIVLVAVYGNIKVDDALVELQQIVERNGFVVVASGAFIGEHSFSTAELPIAAKRPDDEDMLIAAQFGQSIHEKMSRIPVEQAVISGSEKQLPKDVEVLTFDSFTIDQNRCIECGECRDICPVGAREISDEMSDHCILCQACVKICKQNARSCCDERLPAIRQKLYDAARQRHEPLLIL